MSYIEKVTKHLNSIRNKEDLVVLAIESSCDETSCAIMRGDKLLTNIIATQIEIHRRFGGVVPEVASRNHTLSIESVVKEALSEAGMTLEDIDCFAVTYGAGLLGALLIGVAYAKSLAYATGKPLIAVNHIKGHIAANYIAKPDLKPPYLCLIASGGHTAIAKVNDYANVEIIGTTVDDSCGEAFDKVARVLGLPYPGGVQIQRLAESGADTIDMPIPFKNESHFNFSYSGLKTAVINYVHNMEQKGIEINKADLAHSFQKRAIGMLVNNTVRAAREFNIKTVVIAGGVGANTLLRESMSKAGEEYGFNVFYPTLVLCTDNAGMIASECRNLIRNGAIPSDLDLDGCANVKIND